MLDRLFEPIFAPFRALRAIIFNVKNAPARVTGEINRAKAEANTVKADFRGYKDDVKNAPGKLQEAKGKAQGLAGQAKDIKVPKKKMSLFGKKTACDSCGQKLHPSWDECPYCGWKKGQAPGAAQGAAAGGAAPAAGGSGGGGGGAMASPASSGGGPQRTMALDLNAGGGGGGAALGMLGWFIPLEGPRVGELIELRGRITVGKAADNNVVIEDPSISGHHAEFVGSANGFKLNDLGSTNGTFVNDKRVSTHDLVDNDNVKLGKVRFKYKSLS